ncbi:hypothetical protein [Paenibacillus wynnii]|uniref:Uncharacterized protein n=1 Tax=Paenibacillus wynnii TaxID=268407 RepID=A0A098MEU7_9BACL|nr:hypothetical protein [Paenibacillus wynnii]KGE20581.1 hypothetical protein PWYN_15430 [Paenibacillus wynnii]
MDANYIVLTPEKYEELKAQLKKDLQEEQVQPSYSSDWEKIKAMVEDKFSDTYGPYRYQIIQGLSAVIRCGVGISQIRYLHGDAGKQAVEMVSEIIERLEVIGNTLREEKSSQRVFRS